MKCLKQELVVRFSLTKQEDGELPGREELSEREKRNIASMCTFWLSWEPELEPSLSGVEIKGIDVLYDGVTYVPDSGDAGEDFGLSWDEESGEIIGYPAPCLRFYLSKPVYPPCFRRAVFMSSVKVQSSLQRKADLDGGLFDDCNGYCRVLNKKETATLLDICSQNGMKLRSVDMEGLWKNHGMIPLGVDAAGK